MRAPMRTELAVAALMMATQRRRPAAGLICPSDRASQYAAEAYRKQLASMGSRPSTSRTGCCYDCEQVCAARRARSQLTIDCVSLRPPGESGHTNLVTATVPRKVRENPSGLPS
jgi:hypothetical protein